MDTIKMEVGRIAEQVRINNEACSLQLACLHHLVTACLTRLETMHRCDITELISLQHQAVYALAKERGVSAASLDASIRDLNRATATARYLSNLPG